MTKTIKNRQETTENSQKQSKIVKNSKKARHKSSKDH